MLAGSFLYTSPYFTRLPLGDRLTALPLVGPLLEHDRDESTYARYDAITARDLFLRAGVSPRLLRWVCTLNDNNLLIVFNVLVLNVVLI